MKYRERLSFGRESRRVAPNVSCSPRTLTLSLAYGVHCTALSQYFRSERTKLHSQDSSARRNRSEAKVAKDCGCLNMIFEGLCQFSRVPDLDPPNRARSATHMTAPAQLHLNFLAVSEKKNMLKKNGDTSIRDAYSGLTVFSQQK